MRSAKGQRALRPVFCGIRTVWDAVGDGAFFCPGCGGDRNYRRLTGRRRLTVLGIPLARRGETGPVVECAACRARIADAAQAIARDVAAGKLDPSKVNEKTVAKYMYYPDMPDVDLFVRPSGEQRTSNYLIWQSAYAEMVFQDVLWPDFDRRDLWRACLEYAQRDRRFGGAQEAAEAAEAAKK
ncbi:Ditrans,polycis-undecaprenyl-diphosphate synthase ((2E,6E)-farnesyl-diphosphate specific) [Streptomyces microflavus]